jgi:hypothetical protein
MSSATEPAPSITDATSAPPPPAFERTFRPTRGEAMHAQLTLLPRWLVYVCVFAAVGWVEPLSTAAGISSVFVLLAIVAFCLAAPHVAYAVASRETHLRVDARGLQIGPPGVPRAAPWDTLLRVRVTKKLYTFTLRSGQLVILPKRVLGEPERRVLEDALAASGAKVTRRQPASLLTAALWIVGILVFVTVYNLFQPAGRPRRRHPKSGNTPASSLRMPSSTDATGRSSFIEPTIWPTGEVTSSSLPVRRA